MSSSALKDQLGCEANLRLHVLECFAAVTGTIPTTDADYAELEKMRVYVGKGIEDAKAD